MRNWGHIRPSAVESEFVMHLMYLFAGSFEEEGDDGRKLSAEVGVGPWPGS